MYCYFLPCVDTISLHVLLLSPHALLLSLHVLLLSLHVLLLSLDVLLLSPHFLLISLHFLLISPHFLLNSPHLLLLSPHLLLLTPHLLLLTSRNSSSRFTHGIQLPLSSPCLYQTRVDSMSLSCGIGRNPTPAQISKIKGQCHGGVLIHF